MDGSFGSLKALGDILDGMTLHPEFEFTLVTITGGGISHFAHGCFLIVIGKDECLAGDSGSLHPPVLAFLCP